MNYGITRFKKVAVTLGVTSLLALSVVGAGAADIITQSVTAGARTASVADLTLGAKAYSHTAQTSTGTMTLTADDQSGSDAGWNVTVLSSAFVHAVPANNIPATSFSLTSAAAPVMTAGQAVDATGGPLVPTPSPVGPLNVARKTVQANTTFGNGTYTQALGVDLEIPAQSAAGTYTGTLTTTIAAAP